MNLEYKKDYFHYHNFICVLSTMKHHRCRTKSTIPCTQPTLPSPRRSVRKHAGMPKVHILLNDVDSTVESVSIGIANIPAMVTATFVESTSKVDTIATIVPKPCHALGKFFQ